ncbi:MAG: YtxH domain-containing protein [Anaerolineae bacterium]
MHKVRSFLEGLFIGAMVGGGVALLLAPKSGPELQDSVRGYVDHLIEEGKAAAEARRRDLERQLEALKEGRPAITGSDM